jgi:hypothetical protein
MVIVIAQQMLSRKKWLNGSMTWDISPELPGIRRMAPHIFPDQ